MKEHPCHSCEHWDGGSPLDNEYPYCRHPKVDEDEIGELASDYMYARKECPYFKKYDHKKEAEDMIRYMEAKK